MQSLGLRPPSLMLLLRSEVQALHTLISDLQARLPMYSNSFKREMSLHLVYQSHLRWALGHHCLSQTNALQCLLGVVAVFFLLKNCCPLFNLLISRYLQFALNFMIQQTTLIFFWLIFVSGCVWKMFENFKFLQLFCFYPQIGGRCIARELTRRKCAHEGCPLKLIHHDLTHYHIPAEMDHNFGQPCPTE